MGSTTVATVDDRIIAAMRLVLALSALLITWIDPSAPDQLVAVTYLALVCYTLYSLALFWVARGYPALHQAVHRWVHWIDVAWYLLLIALSSGTSSIFFFFFFFAILVASFRHGYRTGLQVVAVSAALFTLVGYLAAPKGPEFELDRFLIRPIYLLVLGYMMASWGGYEIALKRRLALLKDVNTLANPRFGVDRTTGWLLERLRAFYAADACLLVAPDPSGPGHLLRRADRSDPERPMRAEPAPPELAGRLLAFPPELALVYTAAGRPWQQPALRAYAGPTPAQPADAELLATIAAGLDAAALLSVPLRAGGSTPGRLYVATRRASAFDDSDLEFLLQVVAHFTPVVENIRLVDRLASDAAERERQRIAHDLHDSVVQPYIGLQLGLKAISQRLAAGDSDIRRDVGRLIDQIAREIDRLRGYIRGLKGDAEQADILLSSIRRFVDTFAETTGIAVELKIAGDIHVTDRLAAELFQMVAEGLSNIRRHTHAMRATIELRRQGDRIVLHIEDEGSAAALPPAFSPRSLEERASALGGQVRVGPRSGGGSAVVIEIPL